MNRLSKRQLSILKTVAKYDGWGDATVEEIYRREPDIYTKPYGTLALMCRKGLLCKWGGREYARTANTKYGPVKIVEKVTYTLGHRAKEFLDDQIHG